MSARKERRIIPATFADARDLAPRLRIVDRAELHSALGRPIRGDSSRLLMAQVSPGTLAIVEDGKVIGLFGCVPSRGNPRVGVPWLLGSPELGHDPRWLVKTGREWVAKWVKQFDVLYNECFASNAPSIRWLKALGFQFAVNPTVHEDGTEWVSFVHPGEHHV